MDSAYSPHDFEKLVRSSFKHGWLHKRSKGFKAVIPRKRYFVLCDDSLYWFKKEKSCFIQKGELELADMKVSESTSDSLCIEKRSTGKIYILSGSDIIEWAKTLAATLVPFSSCSKELQLSDYTLSNASESAMSKESGKFSRKSTGCSSGGLSSAVSSLPTSHASSLFDGESNPPTPQADLSESSSIDENLIGKPILTKETLEKHNSTMDSIQLNDLTFRVDITHAETPSEDGLEPPNQNVKNAIGFFETLNNSESETQKSKSGRIRQRLFSKFGPETRNRLRTTPRSSSPKSIGGSSIPCSDAASLEFDHSSSGSNLQFLSETSLLSEEIADLNLQGTQTLDELADSLANLVDIFGTMNETIESQTQTNLFYFERGRSLLPPNESRSKKRLASVASEPTLLRIPSDQELDVNVRKNSSYRLSVDYRARASTSYTMPSYTMEKSVGPSLISLQTADEDSFSSIPDVEDVDFDADERFADIEEYIHSKLICHEPISMVELTNCFKGKRLPREAFRKLYEKIRKQVEINRRVSRRQPENLSQLSLLFGHFVDLHSGDIEAEGFREMLESEHVQRMLTDEQMDIFKEDILIPMDFQEFTGFLEDLPSHIGFKLRVALEEHVQANSPLRRVNLRLSEVDMIDFEDDGLTVKKSGLRCIQKGWSLAKVGGETIFTDNEKEDFLLRIEDIDQTIDFDFIASVKS